MRSLSLRLRMVIGVATLVALVAAGSAALCTRVAENAMTRQFSATMQSLAENLARNAAHGVFVESGEVLRELAEHLMDEPEVNAVAIYNADDERILQAGPADEAPRAQGRTLPGPYTTVSTRVYFDAEAESPVGPVPGAPTAAEHTRVIGRVEVTYSRARLEEALSVVRWRIWMIASAVAALGIAAAAWLAHRIVRPLVAVTRATETVAAGDLNVRVEGPRGADELARLAENFNRMAESLAANTEELKRTYNELARKERLATLGQFTAVIAHELRNPLGVILSSAQVIDNENRSADMKQRAARFIVEEVRRLNEDLTAFLSFARPKPPDPRPAPPERLLARAAETFRARTVRGSDDRPTGGERVRVEVDAEAATGAIQADGDQIHQALLNLLFNAGQALGETGGTVRLSAADDGEAIALHVDDDGPGIPDDVAENLFEPFVTTKKKGTGLGLAVVAQIAEANGGAITAGRSPGGGARFTLRLPRAAEATRAAGEG